MCGHVIGISRSRLRPFWEVLVWNFHDISEDECPIEEV